jgi:hypothetical protein
LTDEQVAQIVTYLESLKPAGGCPDDGLPIGGDAPPGPPEAVEP